MNDFNHMLKIGTFASLSIQPCTTTTSIKFIHSKLKPYVNMYRDFQPSIIFHVLLKGCYSSRAAPSLHRRLIQLKSSMGASGDFAHQFWSEIQLQCCIMTRSTVNNWLIKVLHALLEVLCNNLLSFYVLNEYLLNYEALKNDDIITFCPTNYESCHILLPWGQLKNCATFR